MRTGLRRRIALVAGLALAALTLAALPASATVPPGYDESVPSTPDPNPAGPATEATIVDMIHTSGLFGGDVPSATALTPYPTSGLIDQRTVTTAQIVLDDPTDAVDDPVLTYCIDLDTETTIGVHYELGDWTAANVPDLPYVQWILENHYPQVPAAPAAGTDAEKVRAVQGAIWYFTDRFVVSTAYPAERAAVAAIVAAAQAAVSPTPTPPDIPTLTITPATIEASVPGAVVGPFVVGGSVAEAALDLVNTPVYADVGGSVPLVEGAVVASGTPLWMRVDPAVADQRFALTAVVDAPAGAVFLYDGNNPPRTTAQKLVLAAETPVPLRATASIVPVDAGALQIDVAISGPAAGAQSGIELTSSCTADGGWSLQRSAFVPAGTPAGSLTVALLDGLPAGAVCTVAQPVDGSNASAVLGASSITPASVVIASDTTSIVTVADEFVLPPVVTGSLAVDAVVSGGAAGRQSAIVIDAACVLGGDERRATFTVAAGAVGRVSAGILPGVPVGFVCTATQTVDGANARAVLSSSTTTPSTVTIVANASATITVDDVFALPAPAPTPTPTPSRLPDSGGTGQLPGAAASALLLAVGGALLALDAVGRRRARRRA